MGYTAGTGLNSVPAPFKQTLSSNYIDFTAPGTAGWAQQYLPDLLEQEAEVFGNRTISGFLSMVGAEEAMTSDQVIWSEQGRLHLSFKATLANANDMSGSLDLNGATDDGGGGTLTITKDIDGNTDNVANNGIRINDTVLVAQAGGSCTALVVGVSGATISVAPYGYATLEDAGIDSTTTDATRVLVYGSEFGKGKNGRSQANKPAFKSFTNKPIILKDYYEISGSDASQIGWVEVSGEEGQSGYLWYLKAEGDTRARFADYVEMAMLEATKPAAASVIDDATVVAATGLPANFGTEGLFAAITERGHIFDGINGSTATTDLAEFDAILAKFDENGAIEENMMFLDRTTSLAIDDMLAGMNSYGSGGTSYGVFNNSEDMALNLGFSGFRRGSYDFYKSDFKYLNDLSTRGGINAIAAADKIHGVFIPAGVSSVYDQTLGKNLKRPFLHVRYRASQMEDRRFKTWITGSVGGNVTSDIDAMEVHYLSERCLVVQGANNFVMIQD